MREYEHTLMSDQRFRAANATNQHPGSGTQNLDNFHTPDRGWYIVGVGFVVFLVGLLALSL